MIIQCSNCNEQSNSEDDIGKECESCAFGTMTGYIVKKDDLKHISMSEEVKDYIKSLMKNEILTFNEKEIEEKAQSTIIEEFKRYNLKYEFENLLKKYYKKVNELSEKKLQNVDITVNEKINNIIETRLTTIRDGIIKDTELLLKKVFKNSTQEYISGLGKSHATTTKNLIINDIKKELRMDLLTQEFNELVKEKVLSFVENNLSSIIERYTDEITNKLTKKYRKEFETIRDLKLSTDRQIKHLAMSLPSDENFDAKLYEGIMNTVKEALNTSTFKIEGK